MSDDKVTQRKWIVARLKECGEISRNECLRNYISRLGAHVLSLKSSGWNIVGGYRVVRNDGGNVVSKDYVYKWLDFAEKQTK